MEWLIEIFASLAKAIIRSEERKRAVFEESDRIFKEELDELEAEREREVHKLP